jgi:hypothetical protein
MFIKGIFWKTFSEKIEKVLENIFRNKFNGKVRNSEVWEKHGEREKFE